MILNLEHIKDWSEENKVDLGDTAVMIGKNLASSEVDRKNAKIYGKNLAKSKSLRREKSVLD